VRRVSDEREHRRGLVLGLTMAESLLLLLFLLLLALGAKIVDQQKALTRAHATIHTLAPIFAALAPDGTVSEGALRDAAVKLARATELERESERLRLDLSAAKEELAGWQSAASLARQINPDDPPIATVKRILEQSLSYQAILKELQRKAQAYDSLLEVARSISPANTPEATIANSLDASRQAAKAHSDAEVGKGVRETMAVLRDTEQRLGNRLMGAFGGKLPTWKAEFDEKSLTLRFHDPELLFERGSAVLRPGFASILTQLFPEYLRVLYDFRDDIEEVRIEGHTSSEWAKDTNVLDAYFFNMGLSQERTRAVLEYGLTKTGAPSDTLTWAQRMITANGLSSSRLVTGAEGSENAEASRRVEFRVLMRAKERLMQLVEPTSR
jgi:outer membrane protein OmpA-like peptidoglycan-associated protein